MEKSMNVANAVQGTFLVVDGMDGSGKGTQLKLLKAHLELKGIPHIFTREPGGCPEAEKIRERLLSDDTISTVERFHLMWEARVLHIEQTILPALEEGKLVVCDRFDSSTWAYQICGEEHPDLVSKFKDFRRKLVEKVAPLHGTWCSILIQKFLVLESWKMLNVET